MARTGKAADSIFARTTPAKSGTPAKPAARSASSSRPRGRPVAHEEPTTKATVVLFNRQIGALDRITAEIRGRSGNVVDRAAIIRSVLDAVEDAKIDLTVATSGEDVRRIVASKLKR